MEYDNEQNRDLSDVIIDLGETALAAGAGAAFLYKNGGRKFLSQELGRIHNFAPKANYEFAKRAYKDWNYDSVIDTKNKLKDLWKQAGREQEKTPFVFYDTRNTILESINNAVSLKENPLYRNKIMKSMWRGEVISNPTWAAFADRVNKVKGVTLTEKRNFEESIYNIAGNMSTDGKLGDKTKTILTSRLNTDKQEIKDILNEAISFAEKRASEHKYENYKKAKMPVLDQLSQMNLDYDSLERQFGSESNPKRTFLDKVLDDQKATLKDLVDLYDKNKAKDKDIGNSMNDALSNAKRFYEALDEKDKVRYGRLHVSDEFRRTNDGEVYSLSAAKKTLDSIINFAASTTPGSILKLDAMQYRRKAPNMAFSFSGGIDPYLARMTNKNPKSYRTENNVVRVLGKSYKINGDKLEHVKELDNAHLTSGIKGFVASQIKSIAGIKGERNLYESKLANYLDIGRTSSPTLFDEAKGLFNKGSDEYVPNLIKKLSSNGPITTDEEAAEYYKSLKIFNGFINDNNYALTPEVIEKLKPISDATGTNILNALSITDDSTLISTILDANTNSLKAAEYGDVINPKLADLIRRYTSDPSAAKELLKQKSDRSNAYYNDRTESHFLGDLFRSELSQEYFMRMAANSDNSRNALTELETIRDIIGSAGVSDVKNLERNGYIAAYRDIVGVDELKENYSIEAVENVRQRFTALFSGETDNNAVLDFRKSIDNIVREKHSILDSEVDLSGKSTVDKRLNSYIYVGDGINPLDIIAGANQDIREKAAKQFIAGRSNLEDVTSLTMMPYFIFNRLSEAMAPMGLALSNQNTKSVGDLAKNLMLKRVMPLALAYNYYDWADDTVDAVTGQGLTASFVNGVANVDLARRSVFDAVGLTGLLNDIHSVNPISQYWLGRDDIYSRDEQEDYLQNGYSPMRSGRYWWFGSVNEFRGGKIQYFEPNLVRRVNSDYRDKSLYDGYFDKWSHSLLPTPANPLSSLFYLLDPYYLEEKHYDDRPYAVTGPMFGEGTPWGAILNPTIGEIIKPRKLMHQDRLYDGIDVKAILQQMNDQIKEDAANKANANPIFVNGYDVIPKEGYSSIADNFNSTTYNISSNGYGLNVITDEQSQALSEINYEDAQGLIGVPSNPNNENNYSQYGVNTSMPQGPGLSIIGNLNSNIKARAADSVYVESRQRYNKIYDTMDNGDEIARLISQSADGAGFSEFETSARLLSGIYGYGLGRLTGFGDDQPRVADSGDMESFSREFWDWSIGEGGQGAPAESLEIYRRAVPEFRRNIRSNPLMNTMPDWLPAKFRIGDAMTSIPKGEMRLPGKGYESLNELHPDEYGTYGSLDRFKILADIAPYTDEYKFWSKIVKNKAKQGPYLEHEYNQITDRVTRQSKSHEFYNYEFLGQSVDYDNATISDVLQNGQFTLVGSNKVYKLAGVDFKDEYETGIKPKDLLSNYLIPGTSVTIATDNDEYNGTDDRGIINAAVFVDGESVSTTMLENKVAKRRLDNLNAADAAALHGTFSRTVGSALEFVAHLDLPFVYDKLLRVRSPLESYKAEQVYGTPYQTWDEVIGTYLMPAIERASSDHIGAIVGQAAYYGQRYADTLNLSKMQNKAVNIGFSLLNRGAFIGGVTSLIINGNNGKAYKTAQRLGAIGMALGNLYTGSQDSLGYSMLGFAQLGLEVSDFLADKRYDLNESNLKAFSNIAKAIDVTDMNGSTANISKLKVNKSALSKAENMLLDRIKFNAKHTAIGAAVGIAAYGMNNSIFSDESNVWIPDRVKENRDIEEYFDRLNYVKYRGLYEKARREAKAEEGVDVEGLINQAREAEEYKQKLEGTMDMSFSDTINYKIDKFKYDIANHNDLYKRETTREERENLYKLKYGTTEPTNDVNKAIAYGGEYTKSALEYKRMMDKTMYGILESGNWSNVMQAIPKIERDYFEEFRHERNPNKRKELLEYASPLMKRALQHEWGMEVDEMESNDEYFENHNLPSFAWSGWNPNVDLLNVKAKTIQNEGMMLSDFGIYNSQLRQAEQQGVEGIDPTETQDPLTLQANLKATLYGLGLAGVDVSVMPSNTGTIDAIVNASRVVHYNLNNMIDNIF